MSTQSPTPPTPKGPRNNRRNFKRNVTPTAQKATLLTTPPSSPPRNMSPGGITTDSSHPPKKKNGRSSKKPRDLSKASPAQRNGDRHTSSHSNNITTPQLKDSPHYAGPTFHASPAPSALPIPSFFSKSIADSDLPPTVEPGSDNYDVEPDYETTPSKPWSRSQFHDEEPESTPLDFLFKAAVEARNSQSQHSPEANVKIRSPQTDSKTLSQRKLNGSINRTFPLEMESPKPRKSHIGPSFAASYKDRMDALRSASSSSSPRVELDEDQRRAKTEALKNLLLNPRPQRPSSASKSASIQAGGSNEPSTPNARVLHFATPVRATSVPPATLSHPMLIGQSQSMVGGQSPFPNSYTINSQPYQCQQSTLRKGAPSSIPRKTTSNSGEIFSQPPCNQSKIAINSVQAPCYPPAHHQSPVSRVVPSNPPTKALDTKKMEDDIRRILKLDVNPGLPSSGIQSSYA